MPNRTDKTKTILAQYADGPALLDSALAGLTETDFDLTLSVDSWSIRQIVHHLVDGDDIWKTCIKTALDNSDTLFSLACSNCTHRISRSHQGYQAIPQAYGRQL